MNIGHFSFSPYLLNSSTSMCVAILPLYCSIGLFSCLAHCLCLHFLFYDLFEVAFKLPVTLLSLHVTITLALRVSC